MLRPKFDSTLLIAASTCHGMPYAAPAGSRSAAAPRTECCCGPAGRRRRPRLGRQRSRPARSDVGARQAVCDVSAAAPTGRGRRRTCRAAAPRPARARERASRRAPRIEPPACERELRPATRRARPRRGGGLGAPRRVGVAASAASPPAVLVGVAPRLLALLARCSSATMKSCLFVAAFAATSRVDLAGEHEPISAWWNVCIWKNSPSAIASSISSVRPSRIRSAMRAFMTITSTAATRPPSRRGRSRWLITPRSTPARIERICCCFAGGKNSTMRPTVSAASIVCSVEKTRWPDSAACSAVCAVSASRSSPIRITSGSWRSTRRSAWANDSVSSPTSRWLTMRAAVRVEDLDRVLDRDDVLRSASR